MLGTLTFEQTRLIVKFCDAIISLGDNIGVVSVINRHGRQTESKTTNDSVFKTLTKHEID